MVIVYSDKYFADIGYHVFPIAKYRCVHERLLREAGIQTFLEPEPATGEQLLLVHTSEYLRDLQECQTTASTAFSELPLTHEIVHMFVLTCGGTIRACREAAKGGWAIHLGGGYHHAFADKAEGFCYLNDLAVAARVAQKEALVERIAIIDCDLHQGNGSANIFKEDASVFTFSIHQKDLYPVKETSDLDIHLPIHVTDEDYLNHLRTAIPKILDEFEPGLALYQAGADPYKHDQLGSLSLSIEGLQARDELVFTECKQRNIPVVVTLGGGYAVNTEDTVQIHFNTCLAAMEILGR